MATPKMCLTCKFYQPYHCELTEHYIGYLYVQEPTNCSHYRVSADYKKGGKFYKTEGTKQDEV